MVLLLWLGFSPRSDVAKERKEIDPKLKGVRTIFVEGGDHPWVRTARESLEIGRCFQPVQSAEAADAVMTVLWSSEGRAQSFPSPGGSSAALSAGSDLWGQIHSAVIIKILQAGKLKKIWEESIDLGNSEEAKRSGVGRLIEKLSSDVCGGPTLLSPAAVGSAHLPIQPPPGPKPPVEQELRALTYAPHLESVATRPLADVLGAIPELKGLEPAESQEELPGILQKVGTNVKAYFEDFPNTASVEDVSLARVGRLPIDSESGAQRFQYLALAKPLGGCSGLDEYRTNNKGVRVEPRGLAGSYFITEGFISTPLYFHPSCQASSTFRYLGRQELNKRQSYVVAFAQRPSVARAGVQIRIEDASILALVQGIAWINTSSYQIVRMRTDLLPHREEIGPTRVTTKIDFQGVQFRESPRTLWLPREVSVSTDWRGYTYLNQHRYSSFRRFVVGTKVKAAHDATSGDHPSSSRKGCPKECLRGSQMNTRQNGQVCLRTC